ncbi:MAG: hypothetical protein L3J91_04670, partial [Thermoplasmata archaeon]|nr:hypothetical protein [Thermoplasmata archaeon]
MRRPKSPFPVTWLGAIAIVTLCVLPMAPSAPAHASALPPTGPCRAEVPGHCGPALATLRPHPSAGVVAGNWTQLFPSSAPS